MLRGGEMASVGEVLGFEGLRDVRGGKRRVLGEYQKILCGRKC